MTYEVEPVYDEHMVAGRIKGDGFTVTIRYDEYPEQPRWGDCYIGTMLTAHRSYIFGGDADIQLNEAPDTTIECPRCKGTGEDEQRARLYRIRPYGHDHVGTGTYESMDSEEELLGDGYYVEPAPCPRCKGDGEIEVGIVEWLRHEHGASVVLALYLYDHSGLSMSAARLGQSPGYPYTDQWDAGIVGFIFDTKESRDDMAESYATPENIEKALLAEVEEYDNYLCGNVFVVSSHIDGLPTEGESIGGFYDEKYATEHAQEMAEWCEQRVERERTEAANWAARDVITTN